MSEQITAVEDMRFDGLEVVDVLVVTYNSASHIEGAIAALKSQVGIEVRLFVQDNGSVDDTVSLLHSFAERSEIPLELTIDVSNPGFASAVNALIAKSSADLVLILNPDTGAASSTTPTTLRALCDIARNKKTGVVSPRLETSEGTLDRACMRREPTLFRSACTFAAGVPGLRGLSRWSYNIPDPGPRQIEVDAVNGAFMLVERSKIPKVGLLDERYWMYAEDIDWCRSFRSAGYTNICAAEFVWQHVKGGSEEGKRGARTQAAFTRAMSLYYDKHHQGWRHTPSRLLVKGLVWAARSAPRRAPA